MCDLKNGVLEQIPDTTSLHRNVHSQTREAQDRQGIVRQLLLACLGEVFDLDLCGSNRSETGNSIVINGHIGDAYVVTELVLPRELAKETVEVCISRVEVGTVILRTKKADLD
jgi:hypothetical protein